MRKLGSFLLLIIIPLSMFALTRFIMPAQAGSVGRHRVEFIYYKAYIYDDHDGWPRGAGEWYFRFYEAEYNSWTSYRGPYKRDGPGYVDFTDIHVMWYVSGMTPVECACQAREKDSGWDYTSELPVVFGMWYTTPNVWHYYDGKEGDVKHYYTYMVPNEPPNLDVRISGPDNGEPGVPYTYSAAGSDPEGDSITYEWSVDGVIQPSTGSSLTYTFPSAGTYSVRVKTRDYFGAYSIYSSTKTVTITEPTPWDMTGPTMWVPDDKCDMRDVALIAKFFGSVEGDGTYDVRADITGPAYLVADGKIDMRDVALVAKHYGEIYL